MLSYSISKDIFGETSYKNLACVLPQTKLNFNSNSLTIDGHCVNYLDFTKMAIKNSTIKPAYLINKYESYDYIVDVLPLLCVGISESLLTLSNKNKNILDRFRYGVLKYLCDDADSIDYNTVLDFMKSVDSHNLRLNSEHSLALAFSLRRGTSAHGQEKANSIANMLYIIGCKNPHLFIEIFFDFAFIHLKNICMYFDNDFLNLVVLTNKGLVSKYDTNFKYFNMKTPVNTSKKLTNTRGFAISVLNMFLLYTIQDSYGNDIVYSKKNIEAQQRILWNSLGTDFTYRIFKNTMPEFNTSEKNNTCRSMSGYFYFKPDSYYTCQDGLKMIKECYEEEFLFRKAFGVSYSNKELTTRRDINMHYFSYDSLTSAMFNIYCITREEPINIKELKEELNRLKTECNERNSTIKTLNSNICYLKGKLNNGIEELKKEYEEKINNLQYELEKKDTIIENLYNKNDELSSKIQRVYDETESLGIEDDTEEYCEEDALNIVNKFSFLCVGGREGFSNKIVNKGWNTLTQLSTTSSGLLANDISTNNDFDFVIIATKFVSHALIRAVEAKYQNMHERVIYFNGTNVDLLLKIASKFVSNYIGG